MTTQININKAATGTYLITPTIAAQLLKLNTNNRRFRPAYSKSLADAMKRGEWLSTHQGIGISKAGVLLDGQHRLSAIIEANMTISMVVSTGIDNNAYQVIDIQEKRNMGDLTGMTDRVAAVCRLAASHILPRNDVRGRVSSAQANVLRYAGLEKLATELLTLCPTTKRFYTAAPQVLAACLLAQDNIKQKDAIFATYAAIATYKNGGDASKLPKIAASLMAQVDRGYTKSETNAKYNTLIRFFKAYNPDNADISVLKVSDSESVAILAQCKAIMINMVNDYVIKENNAKN
jgi:hypothetical protein